jgi:tRNA dimethylallyltransferase
MKPEIAKPQVIIICGPTGVGKTTVAIDLAQHLEGQIIGADSMQIYKFMDIGTAKPTTQERARVVHHMVDFVQPDKPFDAAQYAEMAREKIIELDRQGITPIVVGGTGLYIKALLHGLFDDRVSDPQIRRRLKSEAGDHGIRSLYDRLSSLDPDTAERLHPNDSYRILRALEVIEATGQAISRHHLKHGFFDRPFESLKIGLNLDRAILYERINRRVDVMISAGFLDEVKSLLARGYAANLKPMQSIGYRHMVDYIEGRLSWAECIQTLKRDHRRYAKRQLTWFRADPEIIWKEPRQVEELKLRVENFMSNRRKTR